MCLLINAFSFWIFIPDLVCKQRSDDVFRSKSPIWIAAYNQSPHEYLICVAAITHFSSPLCPLVDVSLAGMCVLMNVCMGVLQCKLEQQACLTGKDLTLKCSGLCPCPTAAPASKEAKHGEIKIPDKYERINQLKKLYFLWKFTVNLCWNYQKLKLKY